MYPEGEEMKQLSKQSVTNARDKGKKRAAGELIPWTLCQHFLVSNEIGGRRIPNSVRCAHCPRRCPPELPRHGLRVAQLAFCGRRPRRQQRPQRHNAKMGMPKIVMDGDLHQLLLHDEQISSRANLPPLLVRLADYRRHADQLDYVGILFGLTLALLKFWKRLGFVPVYLRQNTNDLTGEHCCVMVCKIAGGGGGERRR
ncbi:hypothetical protein niasHT_032574 [Heterodera trifolii]|uniref:N-acetyltransferase domain-containing protein n=1 Tax=Heterodera trifolii TaxID=157864 RepID=A0ABD2IJR2_9BILA